MNTPINKALSAAVLRLLRPLVRILLRNGVSYGAFADLAKGVFVDIAANEFGIPGRKPSVSRVAVITGLTRKEISRLQALASPMDAAAAEKYNRAARVIGGWVRDSRFHNGQGEAAILPLEGEGASFKNLVRVHSGDVPARAILDELLRVGTVKQVEEGQVQLLAHAYIPRTGEADKLHILGTDVEHLITTIDHNLQYGQSDPRYQRKVAYDNLPVEIIPQLRELTAEKAQALLEEMNTWLSRHDRDLNPEAAGTGRKQAGIGIYYFEHDVPEEN